MTNHTEQPLWSAFLQPATFTEAWRKVKIRAASPGIDRVTVQAFTTQADAHLDTLLLRLQNGTYQPSPGLRVTLSGGSERAIVIPTVTDRIVQRALADVLAPFYDKFLLSNVHSYRKGRSVRTALEHLALLREMGFTCFAKTDITHFFDSIDRVMLLQKLAQDGVPVPMCRLIRRLITAGAIESLSVHFDGGIPQGSALSPLLSNVYLRAADQSIVEAGHAYLRYGDDILLLGHSLEELRDTLAWLQQVLAQLAVTLNPRKTRLANLEEGLDYLGMHITEEGPLCPSKAYQALNASAQRIALNNPTPMAELSDLLSDWESWYTQVDLTMVHTLPLLAALIHRMLAEQRHHAALELAQWRLERLALEPCPWPVQLEVASQWMRLANLEPNPVVLACALLEVVLALPSPPSQEQIDAAADVLGVEPLIVEALTHCPYAAVQACGAGGHISMAHALRLLIRKVPTLPSNDAPAPLGDAPLDEETATQVLKRFSIPATRHLVEARNPRGQWLMERVESPLTQAHFLIHLRGGARHAFYLCHNGNVICAAIVVSLKRGVVKGDWKQSSDRQEQDADAVASSTGKAQDASRSWESFISLIHEDAAHLLATAKHLELPAIIEDSAFAHATLWVLFTKPILLRHAFLLVQRILKTAAPAHEAIQRTPYPNADLVRTGPGPYLPLPLGRHPKSGHFATWVDGAGRPQSPRKVLDLPTVSYEQVLACINLGPLHPTKRSENLQTLLDAFAEFPRLLATLQGCAILRAIADKAHRLGHLMPMERTTLYESLFVLPMAELIGGFGILLARSGGLPPDMRTRLQNCARLPIGCTKIRSRHAQLLNGEACDCRFHHLRAGIYPTPYLHALQISDLKDYRLILQRGVAAIKIAKGPPSRPPAKAHPPAPPKTPAPATQSPSPAHPRKDFDLASEADALVAALLGKEALSADVEQSPPVPVEAAPILAPHTGVAESATAGPAPTPDTTTPASVPAAEKALSREARSPEPSSATTSIPPVAVPRQPVEGRVPDHQGAPPEASPSLAPDTREPPAAGDAGAAEAAEAFAEGLWPILRELMSAKEEEHRLRQRSAALQAKIIAIVAKFPNARLTLSGVTLECLQGSEGIFLSITLR